MQNEPLFFSLHFFMSHYWDWSFSFQDKIGGIDQGRIQDFWGEGEGGWLIPWGCRINGACPQTVTCTPGPEILAMPQSRNYNEVPIQRVCHDIHNLFQFFFFMFCFSKMGVTSHLIHPSPNPPLPLHINLPVCNKQQQGLLAGSQKRHCSEFPESLVLRSKFCKMLS